MKKLCSLLFFIVLTFNYLFAQPKLEAGVFLGLSTYQGDLTQSSMPELGESHLAFGFVARRPIGYTFAVRGNLLYGTLSGSDFNYFERKSRGFTFKTNIIELDLLAEYEPLGTKRYLSGKARFLKLISPYIFGGVGFSFINPKPDFSKTQLTSLENRSNQDLAAGYSKIRLIIPFGIGLKVDIQEFWLVSLDIGIRYPFYDYLDGISISGNPDANDWYLTAGLMVTHRFRN